MEGCSLISFNSNVLSRRATEGLGFSDKDIFCILQCSCKQNLNNVPDDEDCIPPVMMEYLLNDGKGEIWLRHWAEVGSIHPPTSIEPNNDDKLDIVCYGKEPIQGIKTSTLNGDLDRSLSFPICIGSHYLSGVVMSKTATDNYAPTTTVDKKGSEEETRTEPYKTRTPLWILILLHLCFLHLLPHLVGIPSCSGHHNSFSGYFLRFRLPSTLFHNNKFRDFTLYIIHKGGKHKKC
ncbi:hypothetical protein VNO77_18304 [Canavalia gladiata]|uniref:Uncharacterized protein n=1 Tax=Canavalia gladiata TaxID=3824 RepID=A0AAN9LQJ0_CANGL